MPDNPVVRFIYIYNNATAAAALETLLRQYAIFVNAKEPTGQNNGYLQYTVSALESDIRDVVARAQSQVPSLARIFYTNISQFGNMETTSPAIPISSFPSSATASATATTGISSTTVLVVASNPARLGLSIQNVGNVIIAVGTTIALTFNTGQWLFPGGVFEIDGTSLYTGPIYMITQGGSGEVRILEI